MPKSEEKNSVFKINKVTPDLAKEIIKHSIKAGRALMLHGSPGTGKSEIIKEVADELNLEVIDHRLSTSAIEDLTGLPQFTKVNGTDGEHDLAKFTPLNIFPMEWWKKPKGKAGWLLFMDEINSADRSIIAAAYKIILDKMVGLNRLHPDCAIVCAGNLDTDNAIVNNIGTAMLSRMTHIELKVDPKQWIKDVAQPREFDFRITAFISAYPDFLTSFDPEKDTETYACPRTWSFVNDYLNEATDEWAAKNPGKSITKMTLPDWFHPVISGTINSDIANKFVSYCNNMSDMVSFDQILKDPEGTEVPSRADLKYAVMLMCSSNTTKEFLKNVYKYVSKFDEANQVLYLRDVVIKHKELLTDKNFMEIVKSKVVFLKELGVLSV